MALEIPPYDELLWPALRALRHLGHSATIDELVEKVIEEEGFSEEQLADLAERREQIGEQAITDVQAAWPNLIERVRAAVDAGLDPATPQAQKLAAEWMRLLEQFHGGETGLRDSLYRMQAENAEAIEQQHGGPSPDLIQFIEAANAARV